MPTLSDIMWDLQQMALASVRVAMPAVVQSYDQATGRLSAKPIVKYRLVDDEGEPTWQDYPVISDIPIAWPRGGGAILTFPITTGDEVLLVVCDRSIGEWAQLGGNSVEPLTSRKHDPADVVAIPGVASLLSEVVAPLDRVRVGFPTGAKLELTSAAKVVLGNATADLVSLVYDLAEIVRTLTYTDPTLGPQSVNIAGPLPPGSPLDVVVTALKAQIASIKE